MLTVSAVKKRLATLAARRAQRRVDLSSWSDAELDQLISNLLTMEVANTSTDSPAEVIERLAGELAGEMLNVVGPVIAPGKATINKLLTDIWADT